VESTILEDRFPARKTVEYKGLRFFQWFSFGCIAAACAAVMVNLIFTPSLRWSAYVIGGSLSMWLALALGFFKRHNLLKNAIWQMLLISGVCLIWDYATGRHGWSVDYVLPSVCLLIQLSMLIITRVQRLKVQEYMIYYILAGLYGLLPALLLILGAAHVKYLCVLCSGISFLLLTGLLIFKGKDMFSELYKKLHF